MFNGRADTLEHRRAEITDLCVALRAYSTTRHGLKFAEHTIVRAAVHKAGSSSQFFAREMERSFSIFQNHKIEIPIREFEFKTDNSFRVYELAFTIFDACAMQ
jgi:hypothetical protein